MFYGWYIVVASLLLAAYNSAIFIYGFSAFINPIASTFGWSYTQISLAISLRGLETGSLNPIFGMAVDRWPARRLVLFGIIMFGLGVLCISQAVNLTMFYLGFLIIGLGSSMGISMAPQATIARWFRRNVGKATAISYAGFSVGGLFIPLLTSMIDTHGWRNTLLVMAAGMWILGIPLSFVFRSRPEEYGLVPDGKPQNEAKGATIPQEHNFEVGVREAIKMRAFWHIGLASMLQLGTIFTLNTHIMPYLNSLGIERSTASMIAMFTALATIPGRIPFGWLADIWTKKYVAALSSLLTGIGLLLFWLIDARSFGSVVLFIVIFGIGSSGMMPVRAALIREYFGIKRFGTIFGLTSVFLTIGTITGPPLAGWTYDTLGYYAPIWLMLSCASIVAAILLLTMPYAKTK